MSSTAALTLASLSHAFDLPALVRCSWLPATRSVCHQVQSYWLLLLPLPAPPSSAWAPHHPCTPHRWLLLPCKLHCPVTFPESTFLGSKCSPLFLTAGFLFCWFGFGFLMLYRNSHHLEVPFYSLSVSMKVVWGTGAFSVSEFCSLS